MKAAQSGGTLLGMSLLRTLRNKGQMSLDLYSGRLPYRKATSHITKMKMSPHMLGVARRLARLFPKTETADPLDRVTELCQEMDYELGVAHIIRLSTVDGGRLRKLLTATIRNRWSARQLQAEITKLHGRNRRPSAGRKPHPMKTFADVAYALGQACFRLERLLAAVDKRNETEGDIPPAVTGKLAKLSRAVKELRDQLAVAPPASYAAKETKPGRKAGI